MAKSSTEATKNWARYYKAALSPESKLGALRGAMRDGVLPDVLKALKLATIPELLESLHQLEIEA